MLSENRVGSANHHGLFHAISVDRQAPVRLFRTMQGSSEMDGQLVSVCSCFLDCHCRSRGGDVSRIQGPCLLHWDPKAETATKYSRMWSSRVRSSWPPLPPSLLKSGGLQRGCGGQTPLGQKPSASPSKAAPSTMALGSPPSQGPPPLTFIPKDCIRAATSLPILPRPRIPRVFPLSSVPTNCNQAGKEARVGTRPGPWAPSPTGGVRPATHLLPLPLAVLHRSRRLGNLPARTNTGWA